MYIESSGGYTKKWVGRSHTATAYGPDNTMAGTHWSGASLKTKIRKTLVNQPQSIPQLSPMAYLSPKQQPDFRSLNGSLPVTNNQYPFLKRDSLFVCNSSPGPNTTVTGRECVDNIREKSIPEIQTAPTSLDRLYSPHLLTKNILNNNNNTTVNVTTSSDTAFSNNNNSNEMYYSNGSKESRSLSNEIAFRIKEKFDQRVSRHLSKSNRKVKSNVYTYTSQYHLLAVFLVNKGHVEAWYAYAPMPNHYNNNQQNDIGHTRLLELTQRRLRLLQRYYSDSRQYVVLYVNNNNSEHYLPMGLVNDVNCKSTKNKNHILSINKEVIEKDRSFYRFINSLLPNNMKFVNTTDNNNNSSDKQIFVNKKVNSAKSINVEKITNKIDEHQYQLSRQQQEQPINNQTEEKQFSETEQLVKATNSINYRPNLWRRLLEHLISHHQSTDSSTISSKKSSCEDDNNNNSTNIAKENCSDNTNENVDFNCYEKCLHLDSCLAKQLSACPVTPSSTTITMNVTKNICRNNFNIGQCSNHDNNNNNNNNHNSNNNNNNNCRRMKKEDCFTPFKTKTTNDNLSSIHQIRTDDADSQQTIDDKEDGREKDEIKSIKKLSDYEEIWLPKFCDL
ncbi:unnamed protein product [Schistosoma mattheei]|uniref:Aurora kinase n=1 Tax=Schistosoma mattheei TaxID=31246 RepID=A0A183NJZ3_9TREM|nr:unnamed protein product [Schistosoma mattheei]CAH8439398.1 unnamed protein product [Schistosoma mattheei]VDO86983.1 unnamed protein product [Schistosoma mattheei]